MYLPMIFGIMVLRTYQCVLMCAPDLSDRLREQTCADLMQFWQSLSPSHVLKAAKYPRHCGDHYMLCVAMPLT